MINIIDFKKKICMIDFKNHNYITSVKYISSISETILLILLIFRINILYKWYQYNDLDDKVMIDIIKTGYINNNIILK